MNQQHRFEPLVFEASVATLEKPRAAAIPLLDGGEIILFSLKPSLWYVAIVSARPVLLTSLAAAAVAYASRDGWTTLGSVMFVALVIATITRIMLAALQWASRLYVLTNRRVMRFKGVFNVELLEASLLQVQQTDLNIAWYQRWLRLGTIRMQTRCRDAERIVWAHASRPAAVYHTLIRAIRRAQNGEEGG